MTADRIAAALLALVTSIAPTACSREANHADRAAASSDSSAAATRTTAAGGRPAAGFVLPPAQRGRITLDTVRRTTFRPTVWTTATVAFDSTRATQVLSPIAGPVLRILAQPGARVARGAPLALVSSPDYAAAIADYRKAAATARNAQRIADLDQQLWQNDALARRELEQAQTDATAAAADRDAALQQLRALGVDDATIAALRENRPVAAPQGVIRAPIAGTVVERLITPGQLLEAGTTPCFTVADLSRVWVMASVFESDLAAVERGDSVEIRTGVSPAPLRGVVDVIAAQVDPNTKATAVRVVVPNPRELLKKDMYVRAGIHARRSREGLLVPVSAVLRDEDNRPFVFVEATEGGFDHRAVTLGTRVDDHYEITDGLAPGDRVVVEGGLFIQFAESQ